MWSLTSVEKLVERFHAKIQSEAIVPWVASAGCCRYEIENASSATYDWRRLGIVDDAKSPDQADLLIVSGWINEVFAAELKSAYDRMLSPKSVIAVGACAVSGSAFPGVERTVPVTDILPVDMFVPGCPPRPEAILDALLSLKKTRNPEREERNVLYEALKGPR